MMAIAGLIVGSLLFLGFYGYVFWQLYREQKRMRRIDKRLRDHFLALDANPAPESREKSYQKVWQQNLIQVGVAVCGLAGVFAEIGLLNRLIASVH
jgi:hypothetical protein